MSLNISNMGDGKKSKIPEFFVVVLFAITGFFITFLFLNKNYISYAKLPEKVTICLDSCRTFDVIKTYTLPRVSQTPVEKSDINPDGNILFHYNPAFLIWSILILLLMTVASGSVPVFIGYITGLKKEYDISSKILSGIIVFTVMISFLLAFLPMSLHGYYQPAAILHDMKILLTNSNIIPGISIATVIFCLPLIITMFMVGVAASKPLKSIWTEAEAAKSVKKINNLNSILLSSLQVLAIVVVLTGFCSGALGQSIKSVFTLSGFDVFPKEVSYAYGLFFALFLAIFYIPVFYTLKQKGQYLKDRILLSLEGLDEKESKNRKELADKLDTKASALDSLKVALTILSPLLTSFIPEYLRFIK